MRQLLAWASIAIAVVAIAIACSAPDPSARIAAVGPDRARFAPVAVLLSRRCGSLDCHGRETRNLRLYGFGGLRLPPDGAVLPYTLTTLSDARRAEVPSAIEIEASYEAVIALEPETMRAVVEEGGARPERLSLVRKARGLEAHEGDTVIEPGSPADRCLLSWLASGPWGSSSRGVDEGACAAALDDDPRRP